MIIVTLLIVSIIPTIGNCRFHLRKRSFPTMETLYESARMEVYGCLICNLHKVTNAKSVKYIKKMEDASF